MRVRVCVVGVLAAALALALDVQVKGGGPLIDVARGARWGGNGQGGVNAAFILSPWGRDTGYCLVIRNNNPATAHSVVIAAYHTVDQTVTRFAATSFPAPDIPALWIQDYMPTGFVQLAAGASYTAWVNPGNAARIAVVLSGSIAGAGGPDTADVILVQSDSPCGKSRAVGAVCTERAQFTLAAAGASQIAVNANEADVIYVCHVSWAGAAATDVRLLSGRDVGCTVGTMQLTGWYHNVTALNLDFPAGPFRGRPGEHICIEQLGAVAGGGVVLTGVF